MFDNLVFNDFDQLIDKTLSTWIPRAHVKSTKKYCSNMFYNIIQNNFDQLIDELIRNDFDQLIDKLIRNYFDQLIDKTLSAWSPKKTCEGVITRKKSCGQKKTFVISLYHSLRFYSLRGRCYKMAASKLKN
jgi:hypothetical protein